MNRRSLSTSLSILVTGDVVTLALVTLIGFASHGTLDTAGGRMLTTFIPLTAAWFLVAPHLGAFDLRRAVDARQLWRPFWAMLIAAPLAAWLRGVALWFAGSGLLSGDMLKPANVGAPIIPIFVAILGGSSALAVLAWRSLFWLAASRER
jgi:hypothetical protein